MVTAAKLPDPVCTHLNSIADLIEQIRSECKRRDLMLEVKSVRVSNHGTSLQLVTEVDFEFNRRPALLDEPEGGRITLASGRLQDQ